MIVTGMVGSALIGLVLDKTHKYKYVISYIGLYYCYWGGPSAIMPWYYLLILLFLHSTEPNVLVSTEHFESWVCGISQLHRTEIATHSALPVLCLWKFLNFSVICKIRSTKISCTGVGSNHGHSMEL